MTSSNQNTLPGIFDTTLHKTWVWESDLQIPYEKIRNDMERKAVCEKDEPNEKGFSVMGKIKTGN